MNTESKISAIVKTEELEKLGKEAKPLLEFSILDKVSLLGKSLRFELYDDEQGVYLIGRQGWIRATNIFVNKDEEVSFEVPEELKTGYYQIQICRKHNLQEEDSCIDTVTYESPIKVSGFLEVYGQSPADYYYNVGLEEGEERGRADLIKELEDRGIKVPDDLKPHYKFVVVKKKVDSMKGITKVQVKQVATV